MQAPPSIQCRRGAELGAAGCRAQRRRRDGQEAVLHQVHYAVGADPPQRRQHQGRCAVGTAPPYRVAESLCRQDFEGHEAAQH